MLAPLDQESQVVVSHLTLVLGTKLWSFAKKKTLLTTSLQFLVNVFAATAGGFRTLPPNAGSRRPPHNIQSTRSSFLFIEAYI